MASVYTRNLTRLQARFDRKYAAAFQFNQSKVDPVQHSKPIGSSTKVQGPLMADLGSQVGTTAKLDFKASLLKPAPDPVQPPRTGIGVRVSHSALIRQRLEEFRRRSTPKHPVCFKCGSKGHRRFECRNVCICLVCNGLGHQSWRCRVSAPSPQSPHRAESSAPLLNPSETVPPSISENSSEQTMAARRPPAAGS